jgi:hypothetical protein
MQWQLAIMLSSVPSESTRGSTLNLHERLRDISDCGWEVGWFAQGSFKPGEPIIASWNRLNCRTSVEISFEPAVIGDSPIEFRKTLIRRVALSISLGRYATCRLSPPSTRPDSTESSAGLGSLRVGRERDGLNGIALPLKRLRVCDRRPSSPSFDSKN